MTRRHRHLSASDRFRINARAPRIVPVSTNETIADEFSESAPHSVHNALKAAVFKSENQPLEHSEIYNAKVDELAEEIRDGEITVEQAEEEATDTLVDETFGTFGSNNEHNND